MAKDKIELRVELAALIDSMADISKKEPSKELSLAKTKLEEALMWLDKLIKEG